ncbi:G-protein coupled receptor 35 [Echeneis naucrates]|uniref:G-protein coupled receptor 35-like n=1 Tax=Echeneis naucrates TaxID=173247 RepID=A0A665X036_ECHNA|nr:G-protein coupled receptor 35-like [Echeneis naucrates]
MCGNITNSSCKVDILQGAAYSALFIPGSIFNTAALCAFIAKRDSWTDTHIYMVNLAIADSALILFLPFRIYDAFFCLPKTTWCTHLMNVHFINMYASIMTLTAISVHRYLVVKFPFQTRSWRKKKETAVVVCLVIWGLLLSIGAIFQKENDPKKLWTCYERCKDNPLGPAAITMLIVPGFLIPLLIIVFCSTQIKCILSKAESNSEEMKRILSIVMANMIVFIVCYTPIHVAFLVNLQKPPQDWQLNYPPAHVYLQVSEWIAATNCCLDSFSYFFLLKSFYSQINGSTKALSTP